MPRPETPIAMPKPAAGAGAPPSDASGRLPLLSALLLTLILGGMFAYPAGAYPIQNGTACFALLVLGVGLAALGTMEQGAAVSVRRFLQGVGQWPLLGLIGFAAWAALRWRGSEVPAMGREWVIGLSWMGLSVAGGLLFVQGLASLSAEALGRGLSWLRRLMTLALGGFAILAIYQYFFGFEAMLERYQATIEGAVSDYTTQSMLHALEERRVSGRLGNPNLFAAQIAVWTLFVCWTAVAEKGSWRWLAAGVLLAALFALGLTGSRGGWLTMLGGMALAAGIGLMRVRSLRSNAKKVSQGAALVAGGGMALASLAAQAASLGERLGNVATIRERLYYWGIARKIWERNPFIGEGPGAFELFYPAFKPGWARESRYAHSWVLQTLAELGIVGLILIGVAGIGLLFWLYQCLRRRDEDRAAEEASARGAAAWPVAAVLLLGFNGLFEFSLQWREFLVLLGLCAGIGGGLIGMDQRGRVGNGRRWAGWISGGMLGVLLGCAVWQTPRDALARHYVWQGELLMGEGRLEEAAGELRRAVALQPNDPDYLLKLASVVRGMRGLEAKREYERLLKRAEELNPYSAEIQALWAEWARHFGDLVTALNRIDEATERYPTSVRHWMRRAAILLEMGNEAAARNTLLKIEQGGWPVWEYERAPLNALRERAGLEPMEFEE